MDNRLKRFGIKFGILVGALLILTFPPSAHADDFQIWTHLSFSKKFKPSKFILKWGMENRFDKDASRYGTFNTTIGFNYAFFKWFDMGPHFRFEKKRGKDGEYRPFLEFNLTAPPDLIKIKNRQRTEFRIFPDKFHFRYRNRTQFSHLFNNRPVSFRPFFEDEFFVQTGDGFNENRLAAGTQFGFADNHVFWELYYRWQRKKESDGSWVNNHILGTGVGLKF